MKVSSLLSVMATIATLAMSANAQEVKDNKVYTCNKPGQVALTFDDGPGQYADQLLALLDRKKIKVTFFMIGEMITQDPGQAAAVKKYYDAGHQLASHTFTHPNLDTLTAVQVRDQMKKTSDAIFQQAGVRVNYMRAPEGRCGSACMKIMNQELNQTVVQWNVDTNDWRYTAQPVAQAVQSSMKEITETIVNGSDPVKDSFIVLEHEIHKFSVELLAEKVIDAIAAKGYTFVTMEECHGRPAYSVNNNPKSTATASATATNLATNPLSTTTASGAPPSVTSQQDQRNNAASSHGAAKALGWALIGAAAYALL